MIRISALCLVTLSVLAACSSSSGTSPTPTVPVPAIASSPCDVTPPAQGASVFDLRTLRRVQSVGCLGRVQAGLINSTHMQSGDAYFDRSFSGDDLPQSARLHLSIVLDAHIEKMRMDGSTGASYQWWFYTGSQTEAFTATPDHTARIKVALRFVDSAWGVYVDAGAGWESVLLSSFQFGEHEVSALVPVDPAWGMARDASTFFRAVTSSEGDVTHDAAGNPQPITDVGDVYPRDLHWLRMFDY